MLFENAIPAIFALLKTLRRDVDSPWAFDSVAFEKVIPVTLALLEALKFNVETL